MLASPANSFAAKGLTGSQLSSFSSGLLPGSFIRGNNSEPTTQVPKAFINYIFFDEQFKYAGGNFSRVGVSGIVKDHWQADAGLQNIKAPKNGYVFVYVSNESNFDVFFDNIQVIHKPGPLLEETHYYPFGLTMAGISSKASGKIQNKLGITSKEKQDKEFADGSGLELYDFEARYYEPQIGRWHALDPLAEWYENSTPYSYVLNNPLSGIDPTGRNVIFLNDKNAVWSGVIGHASVIIGNSDDGYYYYSMNGTGEGSSPVGTSLNPDLGTYLGKSGDINQLIQTANTVNPKEPHNYDRFVSIKTTKEEDNLMKQKAKDVASSNYYIGIGSSCLDVSKAAYSALANSRVGVANGLIDQQQLRLLEPNLWLEFLPITIGKLNSWISVFGGEKIERKKSAIIIVHPLEDKGIVKE